MSMPQYFRIVVVSGNQATSSVVTSILRWHGMSPEVLAAYDFHGIGSAGYDEKMIFALHHKKLIISITSLQVPHSLDSG